MNLVNDLQELALATRLKRLGERLSNDVNKVYKESDLDFEAKWYLILALLAKEKSMAITEIADSLQLSHPAIIQFVNDLMKKKYIIAKSDKNDGRKRIVSLSLKGKKLLLKLNPILESIKEETKIWVAHQDYNILEILEKLEQSLDEQSMYQRVKINLLQH